ncbi:Translation machinery-associated protein 46 [Linderina macrospora]|uniref:Translation machinery-associated protein 46 n=1 Tax=Linderina macrospora TaxID=4868 RepID=A0ACC1JD52_9FUNG|nr:Translation machinery-associated protein 46 [Linderina macrospora]
MPPKKGAKGPSRKTQDKDKKKTIEDKTFGLKNKNKSKKVGEYVKQVEQQVMSSGSRKDRKQDEERKQALNRKKEEERQKLEMLELFKPVQTQKVPFGVNPKSVLCQFFKAGQCSKGDRCKFSHDLSIERKGQKMDIYTDKRDADKEADTMENWDQSQLEEVVLSKHGNPRTTTNIVCKHFLAAIESSKYGWFWECPNGGDKCMYKHALPPGFVLKRDKKKDGEEKDEISLEEFLETERHKLGDNQTPVTLESFTKWKADRKARKEAEELKAKDAKAKAFKAGKAVNMSGRDFFEFNPELDAGDNDDGDEFDFSQYRNAEGGYQQDEQDEQKGAQNEDLFAEEDVGDISDEDDDEE